MRRLVTGKQMKEIDAYAIQTIGILSMVLMERAALAVADELMQEYQRRGRKPVLDARVLVFCGTGNNGADGAAIARISWGLQLRISADICRGVLMWRWMPCLEWDFPGSWRASSGKR